MSDLTIQKMEETNIRKTIIAQSNELYRKPDDPMYRKQRGLQISHVSQLIGMTGRDDKGRLHTVNTEYPVFYLTLDQRNEIFRLSSPVLGVVTSRMNRISAMDFNIEPIKNDEDKIIDNLKNLYSLYNEYKNTNELTYITIKAQIYTRIKEILIDILPDLSNFNNSLMRWKKRIMQVNSDRGVEIKEWMMQPNLGTSWEEYIKKYVYDLMIHGAVGTFKSVENKKLENFDTLPGGSIYKIRNPAFGGIEAYIQAIWGFEFQLFFSNEISYNQYIPTSTHSFSYIPLEALINKISEGLLFDKLMADQADGTKPPEKLIIITDNQNPFNDFEKTDILPADSGEQARLEAKVNEPKKNAIMTFSGNDAKLIDISRENTMGIQRERQKDIREDVAVVFNMSNMEVNLTGSEDTSGRATSEAQAEIEKGKGVMPILQMIENMITRTILPFRYGYGYKMEFQTMKDEYRERQLDMIKLNNGEITQNELREKYNQPIFEGEEFNKPKGVQAGMGIGMGESEISPMFTKEIK